MLGPLVALVPHALVPHVTNILCFGSGKLPIVNAASVFGLHSTTESC